MLVGLLYFLPFFFFHLYLVESKTPFVFLSAVVQYPSKHGQYGPIPANSGIGSEGWQDGSLMSDQLIPETGKSYLVQ